MANGTALRKSKVFFAISQITKNFKKGLQTLAETLYTIGSWKVNRATDPDWADQEYTSVDSAYTIDGVDITQLATADHTHDEYVKIGETVDYARNIVIDGVILSIDDLAPAKHTHDYFRVGEPKIVSRKVGGALPENLAPASHQHSEYLLKNEIVEKAFEVNGYTAGDFALKTHNHDDTYYKKTDTVANALQLIENNTLYGPENFARRDHAHPQYITKEEADKLFLKNGEPYYAAEKIQVTKRSAEPTTSVDESVSNNFAIMQIPEMIDQAKSDIGVLASLGSPTTSYVLAYATTFFTCPGRWFEIVLPVSNNIAAVVLTILDATEEINYLTHFTAWSGNKFRVYQYDYPGSKTMKVQALIFVDE